MARLGITTDTDDAEGQTLLERPVGHYALPQIDAALRQLTGRIQQRPPIYSALKRGGEPLYAKARRGELVEVEARQVEVHRLELQSAADLLDGGEPLLRMQVECGSGTYVRSLSATWASCWAAARTWWNSTPVGGTVPTSRACGPSKPAGPGRAGRT